MIGDQFNGNSRVDLGWVSAKFFHCIPHGGKIDYRWYSGEILHQDPGRMVGYFDWCSIAFPPSGYRSEVFFQHDLTIKFSQQVFHKNAD